MSEPNTTNRNERRKGGPGRAWAMGFVVASLSSLSAQADLLFVTDASFGNGGAYASPRDILQDAGTGPFGIDSLIDIASSVPVDAFDPLFEAVLYSPAVSMELPGSLFVHRADVVRTDGSVDVLEFDASAEGVPLGVAVDAVARDGIGGLLLSFDTALELDGTFYGDEDLVRFDGAVFSPFFDGSASGVADSLDMDGAWYDVPADALLISFDGAGTVGGVFFANEDVVRFDRGAGTWALEFDGSARDASLAPLDLVAVPEPGFGVGLISCVGLGLVSGRGRKNENQKRRISMFGSDRSRSAALLSMAAAVALTFLASAASNVAHAQGYIEINQAVVDNAGGFPFTISQPGQYRLTGDVVKPASVGNAAGIVIAADNVTLDLGGFGLRSEGVCARNASSGAVTCFGHVPGTGIQSTGQEYVTIRNGRVSGWFNGLSLTGAYATIEFLNVSDNAFLGISAIGDGSTIRASQALRNGTTGMSIQNNSSVENCTASQNDDYGIIANLASSVVDSTVLGNRLGGMSLNSQAIFDRNVVGDNFGPDPVISGDDGGNNTCTNGVGTVVAC